MRLFARKSKVSVPTDLGRPAGVGAANGSVRLGVGVAQVGPGGVEDEARVRAIGEALLATARGHRAGLLSARFYQDKLMDWSMKDQNFKVQLFRFVDAFPALTTPDAVHEHLVDYLTQPGVKLPPFLATGMRAGAAAKGLLTKTVSTQINSMAETFIAGTDAASALPKLEKLWRDGIGFSVDLLGEACVSDDEADMYRDKYLDLVTNLPETVAGWGENAMLERDHLGAIPRTNVSIKVSALSARLSEADPEGSIRSAMTRIVPILEAARDRGVFINFDMEHHALKELTIALFQRCVETVDFEGGIAMQAYLRSGRGDAARMCAWAKERGRCVTVRLVKGAYWDFETIHAEAEGWPCPVWGAKHETDACFEDMSSIFLDAMPRSPGDAGVKLALGSHTARSIAGALAGLEARGLPREALELQMLHGMADQLKGAASAAGTDFGPVRVREYVPVGEMIPGMAYLVRRLLENTSNESWLKAGFMDEASAESLLADPREGDGAVMELLPTAPERHGLSPAVEGVADGRAFFTEPMRDFAEADQRDAFAAAIGRARVRTVASDRTPEDAARMVGEAAAYFPAWRDTDAKERSACLARAADAMRARRDELAGMIIKENGKGWRDADGDVTEAIDFCDYYARTAPELFEKQRLGRFIGELNEHWHQPRGVAAVISPWNFPLAIACGMVSAALVTGNTVVLKPAEQTAGIAAELMEIMWAAGVPREALHFCPAPGETTGAALVRDPRVALVAFTGARAVGLDIIEACGRTGESQAQGKRVVCEMGGKNAVIVDVSADLDEAVLGVRQSAFGFQGQKCSACSRVIVVDPIGEDGPTMRLFLKRLVASAKSLNVGSPMLPGTDVGPVIDEAAFRMIRGLIARARDEGATVAVGDGDYPEVEADTGALREAIDDGVLPRWYVPPHVLTGVKPGDTIAREEVFGPVLAVLHARDFDEALAIANDSQYKLTGGVFTRKPTHIDRAKRELRVGNLYVNRGITGALVGRQPFGGFGMSGVGSKAGGPEYLQQFVEPRASCENTMRRGFAPEL